MSWGRRIALTLALVAAATLATGSGGFSAAAIDRGMEVQVVSDDEAYFGIQALDPSLDHTDAETEIDESDPSEGVTFRHQGVDLFRISNRFAGQELAVESTISGDDAGSGPDHVGGVTTGALSPGDSGHISVDVDCPPQPTSETWQVTVTAEGDGVSLELTRSVTVDCQGVQTPVRSNQQ